jgi:ribonuclease BN (tRNA processing enzyme)
VTGITGTHARAIERQPSSAVLTAAFMLRAVTGATAGNRLVMLGVDGGPRLGSLVPDRPGAKPALALVVEGAVYLIDAGFDTARQLVASGLGFGDISDVFITHHHFDHTSGLPGLVLHGWTAPRALTEVSFWGPPTMSATVTGIESAFGEAARLFSIGGGFGPRPVLSPNDVALPAGPGVYQVMEDDRVRVAATRVFHGPEVDDAYAYRFTVKSTGKVIVFSGDTAAPDANLIDLARDCDVLVHEVQDNDNVERLAQSFPTPERGAVLREHLLNAHSDVRDLPRVGLAAGAGRVVFSHYTPLPQAPEVYLAKAQAVADDIGYSGTIIAPSELDVVEL